MQYQDKLQAFIFQDMDIRGQITTLAACQSEILAQHDYPPSVALVFSEFLAAVSLLGATLKYSGRVILQAKGRGVAVKVLIDFIEVVEWAWIIILNGEDQGQCCH